MEGGLDLKVRAAPDQRATRDQQLGEDRDRVSLGVRCDLLNDRAGQPVVGSLVGRCRPARRHWERRACGLAAHQRCWWRVLVK